MNASSFTSHEEYLQWHRDYRTRNAEKLRKYNRKYIKAWRKKYGLASNKAYKKRYPEKLKAQNAVGRALKRGLLKKKPCEKCGKRKSQAHHDDYKYALEVRWLCSLHHAEEHKTLRLLST